MKTVITSVLVLLSVSGSIVLAQTTDDLVFLHHSCGQNWLSNSLHNALLAKDYIDERNDIYYGTDLAPDAGRRDSLAPTPGDRTNMNHWILWFNDYLGGVKKYGCANGINKIVMFKSCYPISNVSSDGTEPGDPFSGSQTLANYKAVYRHPDGPGHTYSSSGYTYKPLEDIFAANPDTLFIPVTAPPLHYAPGDATNNANAHRARQFNNWLKNDWLSAYNAAHPNLKNVAVFDWFDVLAYADNDPNHPNRLKQEYGGASGNSHPNSTANAFSTQVFATNANNFIDRAWQRFSAVPGDANKDGLVDVGDLGILAGNYGVSSGATWAMGDFNDDGKVDVGDLGILAGNYGYGSAGGATVPEPIGVLLLGAGIVFFNKKR